MFEPGTKINPRKSAKATPVLTQDQRIEAKPSPEDEWASLWDELRKAKGKLKVLGGHRVGWLHDMIETTPFCDFRITSERRLDSILSIQEGAHGIAINTSIDSPAEKIDGQSDILAHLLVVLVVSCRLRSKSLALLNTVHIARVVLLVTDHITPWLPQLISQLLRQTSMWRQCSRLCRLTPPKGQVKRLSLRRGP